MCWAELSEYEKFQNKRLLHSRIPLHAWLVDNINYCGEHAKQQSAMQTSYMLEASLMRTISPIQGFCPRACAAGLRHSRQLSDLPDYTWWLPNKSVFSQANVLNIQFLHFLVSLPVWFVMNHFLCLDLPLKASSSPPKWIIKVSKLTATCNLRASWSTIH